MQVTMDIVVPIIEETRYLRFDVRKSESRRTLFVLVRSNRSLALLGTIKWYSQWRQYAFFPKEGTLYNRECMSDIRTVMMALTEQRKKLKGKQ